MKKLLCGFLVLVYSIPAMAVSISGTVQDTEGNPLVGANVVFSDDGTKGVASDQGGRFNKEFKGVSDDGEVKISYVGYKTQKLKAKDLSNATITMEEAPIVVEEVVVVGKKPAEEVKKKDVSAESVSSVADEVKEGGVVSSVAKDKKDVATGPNDGKEQGIVDEFVGKDLEPDRTERINAAQKKYDAAKENEQSLQNRMRGGLAMGTMGVGGMMVAQSLAEQNADAAAEADMAAYLETFRCDYGAGTSVKGGETNVQLSGAAELIPLYAEYVALANDLKSRKAQLGLKAGIESEKILDSATTGLYDDVSGGVMSGAYASLARALQNPDGEDAKKWAEQNDKSVQNLKIGAGVAGVGVVADVFLQKTGEKAGADKKN